MSAAGTGAGGGNAGGHDAGAMVCFEALVYGAVQGVGFRYRTRQRAEGLGLAGSATNLPDGSVRVVAQGPSEPVRELLGWLGSPETPGRVERVETTERDVSAGLAGFDVG